MLIAHRDRLRKALTRIVELVDSQEEVTAERLLMDIGNIAEAALKL